VALGLMNLGWLRCEIGLALVKRGVVFKIIMRGTIP
jgi:hypothetical protein